MSKNVVVFNELNHTYTVDGVEAISVTQLLKATGISKGFDESDKFLMEKVKAASEKGIYYDKLAEEAINDPFELTEWQERFLKVLHDAKLNIRYAQPRFGTLKPFAIAGTGDFKGVNIENGKKVIVDLKATYEIYMNPVTWQTNLYSWLDDPDFFETSIEKYVIHYSEKDDRFTLLKLKDLTKKNIEKLLESYQLDEKYSEATDITTVVNLKILSQAFSKVQEYKALLEEEQKKLDGIYKEIENYMADSAIKTLELEEFKITYTEPGVRRNVDYTKATEDKNIEKLKTVNEFLTANGQEEYKLITVEEVKESLTDEEKEVYTSISNVKGRLTVTPIKKKEEKKKK
jgi:hypothetical protein